MKLTKACRTDYYSNERQKTYIINKKSFLSKDIYKRLSTYDFSFNIFSGCIFIKILFKCICLLQGFQISWSFLESQPTCLFFFVFFFRLFSNKTRKTHFNLFFKLNWFFPKKTSIPFFNS